VSCTDNYACYRVVREAAKFHSPHLPVIAVLCRDISNIRLSVPSTIGRGALNLDKLIHVSIVVAPKFIALVMLFCFW